MAAQVPYTVILLSSFELSNRIITNDLIDFDRYDDYSFVYKFLSRFGAATISVTLATAICYPLDTMKRMYQLEGTLGHSERNSKKIPMARYMWLTDGKLKGFYRGFSVALAKAVPLALVQFICFQNLSIISRKASFSDTSNQQQQ